MEQFGRLLVRVQSGEQTRRSAAFSLSDALRNRSLPSLFDGNLCLPTALSIRGGRPLAQGPRARHGRHVGYRTAVVRVEDLLARLFRKSNSRSLPGPRCLPDVAVHSGQGRPAVGWPFASSTARSRHLVLWSYRRVSPTRRYGRNFLCQTTCGPPQHRRRTLTTPPATGAGSDGNRVLDQWACLLEPPGEACGESQWTTVRLSVFTVDDQPQAPETHTPRGLHLRPEQVVPNEPRPLPGFVVRPTPNRASRQLAPWDVHGWFRGRVAVFTAIASSGLEGPAMDSFPDRLTAGVSVVQTFVQSLGPRDALEAA